MSSLLPARLLVCCAVVVFSSPGCAVTHTGDSTETGNPPVIDLDRVALEISSGSVKIVGGPGAVKPGSIVIEITVVQSGENFNRVAAADGSFEIDVHATANDVIALVAVDPSGQRSKPVYVARAGAWVGDGDSGLSCRERSEMATQVIEAALVGAEVGCHVADDCGIIQADQPRCSANCFLHTPVAQGSVPAIGNTLTAIRQGLCKTFVSDGCMAPEPDCVDRKTRPIDCIAGRCQIVDTDPAGDAEAPAADGGQTGAPAMTDPDAEQPDAGDSSCEPTGYRRPVDDVCFGCGAAGECLKRGYSCAIMCENSNQCPYRPNFPFECSDRHICETVCR